MPLDGAALQFDGEGDGCGVWRKVAAFTPREVLETTQHLADGERVSADHSSQCGASAPAEVNRASRPDADSWRSAECVLARLEEAFDRCGDCMYRFILLRVSNDRHVADDILQQTCFEAAKHRRIPRDDNGVQAWLFGIAKNLIRKHYRHVKRDSRQRLSIVRADGHYKANQEKNHNPDGNLIERDEAVPRLLNAIASLNEGDQELILGSYFEGRSHEELARVSGVSVRAIEGRLYRARNALRVILGPQLGEIES